jgi:hypothetical protein
MELNELDKMADELACESDKPEKIDTVLAKLTIVIDLLTDIRQLLVMREMVQENKNELFIRPIVDIYK